MSVIPQTVPQNISTPPRAKLTQCPDCGGAGFFRLDVPLTDKRFGKPIRCENPTHQDTKLKRLAELSGLQYSDLERRLDDIEPNEHNVRAITGCRQIIDRGYGWLWVYGGPGNGKSEMLIAVVNEINIFGAGPAMYIRFSDLLDYMRRAFAEDAPGDYTTRFQKIVSIPVLAIDEMDKVRATEFADEFRFALLDDRYRRAVAGKSATLFASNNHPQTLPEAIWDRMRDGRFNIRLADGSEISAVIENGQASARPAMKARAK